MNSSTSDKVGKTIRILPNNSTVKGNSMSRATQKVGEKNRGSRNRYAYHGGGTTKQTGSNKDNDEFLSEHEDGTVFNRRPWVLYNEEFVREGKLKIAYKDEKMKEREKLYAKAAPTKPLTNSSGQPQDSSVDKSSDSGQRQSGSQVDRSSVDVSMKSSDDLDQSDPSSVQKNKKKKTKKRELNEEQLLQPTEIKICETPTTRLFFIPSATATPESKDVEEVKRRNEIYQNLVSQTSKDNSTKRAAQTKNYPSKEKLNIPPDPKNPVIGCECTVYDIQNELGKEKLTEFEKIQLEIKNQVEDELETLLKNPLCLLPEDLTSIKKQKEGSGGRSYVTKTNEKNSTRNVNNSKTLNLKKSAMIGGNTNKLSNFNSGKPQQATSGLNESSNTSNLDNGDARSTQKLDGGTSSLNPNSKKEATASTTKPAEVEIVDNFVTDEEKKVYESNDFQDQLKYVERILNQADYLKKILLLRNYPEFKQKMDNKNDINRRLLNLRQNPQVEDRNEEEDKSKILKLLFNYSYKPLSGRTVSSADFNTHNPDLLAVTYGEFDIRNTQEGYVALWTPKNPNFPERLIKMPTRALCCQFSKQNPNLLGVGSVDGVVSIFDLRRNSNKPIADSKELENKHLDAVWEVQWVGKGTNADKGEGLISISSDGRVVEWVIKKGLDHNDLKHLQRFPNRAIKGENLQGINFRSTTGFTFDFFKNDTINYLVGTEDGTIHRCSKSYKERYLNNYFGHTGPVYRVRVNPFASDIFLSCSSDWTCKVWNAKEEKPKLNLRSLDLYSEVMDIDWSPFSSTVFASVARDGRLEFWDLAKANMDPVVVFWDGQDKKIEECSAKTMVKFSKKDPVLVCGGETGDIHLYRIFGYEDTLNHETKQYEKLQQIFSLNDYSRSAKEYGEDTI